MMLMIITKLIIAVIAIVRVRVRVIVIVIVMATAQGCWVLQWIQPRFGLALLAFPIQDLHPAPLPRPLALRDPTALNTHIEMSDGDASPSRRKPIREEASPSKRKDSPSRSRSRKKEDDDEAPTTCPAWLQQWTSNIQDSLNSTIEKSIQDLNRQVLNATNIAQNAQEITIETKTVVIDLTTQVAELTIQIKSPSDEIKNQRDRFDNMGKDDPIEVDEGAREGARPPLFKLGGSPSPLLRLQPHLPSSPTATTSIARRIASSSEASIVTPRRRSS